MNQNCSTHIDQVTCKQAGRVQRSMPGPSDLRPTYRRSGRARRPQIPAGAGTVLDPHNLFRIRPLQTRTVENRQRDGAVSPVIQWSVPGPSDLRPTYRQGGRARRPQIPAGAGTVLDPHNLFCTLPHLHAEPTKRVALLQASPEGPKTAGWDFSFRPVHPAINEHYSSASIRYTPSPCTHCACTDLHKITVPWK
mgnify:CR=1 FL=1